MRVEVLRRGTWAGIVAGLALAASLVQPDHAGAIAGACISTSEGAGMNVYANDGERNRQTVGFKRVANRVRIRDRAFNPTFDFNCSAVSGAPWDQVTLSLGDRPDTARLDAKGPVFQADNFGPLPPSIDAIVDADGGDDKVVGRQGSDLVRGGSGHDRLLGEGSADILRGGRGGDLVDGGSKSDVLRSDQGSDRVKAIDGNVDVVRCGSGRDFASVDAKDSVRGCENVAVG
jgi:Ca2+-binding RTX toxin-like protein